MDIDKVLLHLSELFQARNEDVSEFEEHADAVLRPRYFNEFIVLNTNATTVFFTLTKELLRDLMKEFKEHEDPKDFVDHYKTKNFIIVLLDPASPATSSSLLKRDKDLSTVGGMLQVFLLKELMYNPSKHSLVPKHEKLTEAESKELLEKLMIKSKSQLPTIHKTDAMAKWLGLRHGEIVRITRHNDTSGEYYYYRCCV
jgi:DNA-directed RNA polymerase I, II, and III subunit RPABC1